jgi:putative oxidoreductase
MRQLQNLVFKSVDDYRSVIPRIIVGLVFLSEGIQKFLFPGSQGAARFERIGFAHPDFLASLVGSFEIACGFLVLIGLVVRLASVPLLTIMATAVIKTKIPIMVESGFWTMAHEARTDFAMTLLLVFIVIYGSGKLSVDHFIRKFN